MMNSDSPTNPVVSLSQDGIITARALPTQSDTLRHWLATALGLSIPISTTASEFCCAALALLWLCSGSLWIQFSAIRRDRFVLAGWGLFAWFAIGAALSHAAPEHVWGTLGKYRILLLIPILQWALEDRRTAAYGFRAFSISMVITLAASYLMRLGVLESKYSYGFADNCAFFKNHITQNLLMVFFVYLLVVEFINDPAKHKTNIILVSLAMANVMFMVYGRTAYLVVLALALLIIVRRFGARGIAVGSVALPLLAFVAYRTIPLVEDRVDLAVTEAREFARNPDHATNTSIGRRAYFYQLALEIVADHPLIGTGVGSFGTEVVRRTGEERDANATNPHSEYLHAAVSGGILGIALLGTFLLFAWRTCTASNGPYSYVGQGAVTLIAVGSLFNSLLMDATEGLLLIYCCALARSGHQIAEPVKATLSDPNRYESDLARAA